jgi:hypothetical protein
MDFGMFLQAIFGQYTLVYQNGFETSSIERQPMAVRESQESQNVLGTLREQDF